MLFDFLRFGKHIFYKYAVARGGVVDENVGIGADRLSVPDYTPIGASALCALGASHCVCPRGKPPRSNLRHSP